jgi:hypothetical protein
MNGITPLLAASGFFLLAVAVRSLLPVPVAVRDSWPVPVASPPLRSEVSAPWASEAQPRMNDELRVAQARVSSSSSSAERPVRPAERPSGATPVPGAPERPLALDNLDPSQLNLNEDQLLAVDQVRELFAEMVGNAEPDPADAAVMERWEEARRYADNVLRARLGDAAVLKIRDYLVRRNARTGAP